MLITFNDYIQNPMGKDNAVISNRAMYAKMYLGKLDRILVREAGKIDIKAFTIKDRYICYLKIPSEIVPNFYYDTVIEFTPPKGVTTDTTLRQYYVKFYSNDPSFVYTFAHAFIKNEIFIKWLTNKMSPQAVKKNAVEKNPQNQVGYVKSLYFAYLIMNKRGYFSKTRYTDNYDEKTLLRNIEDADKKLAAREKAGKEIAEQNRKHKEKVKKVNAPSNVQIQDIPIQPKPRIGTTKSIGTTSKLKKTNVIKRTGSIRKK